MWRVGSWILASHNILQLKLNKIDLLLILYLVERVTNDIYSSNRAWEIRIYYCEEVTVSVSRSRLGWVYCANVSCHHIEVHNKMAPLYNGWLMTRAWAESLICPAWPGLNTHQATQIRALRLSSWLWTSPRDWSVNTNILSQDIKDPLETSQSHTFTWKFTKLYRLDSWDSWVE